MNKGIVTPQKGVREKENAIMRVFAAHLAEAGIGGRTPRTASPFSKTSCFTFQSDLSCIPKSATSEGKTSRFTSSGYRPSITKYHTLLFFLPMQLSRTKLSSRASMQLWRSKYSYERISYMGFPMYS